MHLSKMAFSSRSLLPGTCKYQALSLSGHFSLLTRNCKRGAAETAPLTYLTFNFGLAPPIFSSISRQTHIGLAEIAHTLGKDLVQHRLLDR